MKALRGLIRFLLERATDNSRSALPASESNNKSMRKVVLIMTTTLEVETVSVAASKKNTRKYQCDCSLMSQGGAEKWIK